MAGGGRGPHKGAGIPATGHSYDPAPRFPLRLGGHAGRADRGAGDGPALGKGQADVAVVGAGVFGAFTALALQERGHHVLSLDQYGPVSPRASSSGETRSIRSGYGDQAFYSAWSARGLAKWRLREAEFGRKLLYPSARIEMTDHWTDGMIAQRKIFDDLKLPYEIAQRDELRRRFPQMAFDDVDFAFVETSTSSVLVKAREAVLATIEHFEEGRPVALRPRRAGRGAGRRLLSLKLDGGDTVSAGSYVFAVAHGRANCCPGSPARASMSGAANISITARPPVTRAFHGRTNPCGMTISAADGALAASSGA
jgi:glycine/D-amino acid oxidase-like deaminating enzyme